MTTMDDLLYPGKATDFFARRPFPPFDPTSSAYNRGNALWLAELSRLVYRQDQEEVNPPPQPTQACFLEKAGCTRRHFFHSLDTGTQAILAEFNGGPPYAALVFRGTEQETEAYIQDLGAGKLRHLDGKIDIHEGFRSALDSVWKEIDQALRRLNCPVYFTGHSLGAALATLAATRHTPTALYTFGSPRVGDANLVASLQGIAHVIHRVVDDKDGVTHLPPEALGFQHVGTLHTLTEPVYRKSITEYLTGWCSLPKFLADHAPVNYVDRI